MCLCAGHHTLLSTFSAHKTPIDFITFIRGVRGDTWYKRLQLKANNPAKLDYNLELLYLKNELKKYE